MLFNQVEVMWKMKFPRKDPFQNHNRIVFIGGIHHPPPTSALHNDFTTFNVCVGVHGIACLDADAQRCMKWKIDSSIDHRYAQWTSKANNEASQDNERETLRNQVPIAFNIRKHEPTSYKLQHELDKLFDHHYSLIIRVQIIHFNNKTR